MATSNSTAGGQHHASLNLMACVRESSPLQEDLVSDTTEADLVRNDPGNKKRRFHPFRGLRRMFRKKVRHQHPGVVASSETHDHEAAQDHAMLERGGTPVQALEAHRSRSTCTLLSGEDAGPRRRSGNGLFPCHSGLSVSHDSVFTAEHRTPPHSSSEDLDTAQSSSSLSIQQMVLPGVRAELLDALRRRRGRRDCTSDDDEDLGLPHSPCNSPTTADVLLEQGLKENPTKSHSTCSDGSLLSMGSSEMDEDSLGLHSGCSSKLSLHDKKTGHENDLEFDLGVSAVPLSHSAARHKMAVKPKRTHGAPRRKRIQQLTGGSPLPSTPELNEEASGRSASPDIRSLGQEFTGTDELCTAGGTEHATAWPSVHPVANLLPAETHLKSASLPPGLALTPEMTNAETAISPIVPRVKRHHSNITQRQAATVHQFQHSTTEHEYGQSTRVANVVGYQCNSTTLTETVITSKGLSKSGVNSEMQKWACGVVGEEDEETKGEDLNGDMLERGVDRDVKKRDDMSFFSRFMRRSGRKKKGIPQDAASVSDSDALSSKQDSEVLPVVPKRIDLKGRYASETVNDYAVNIPPSQMRQHSGKVGGSRSTPASRQRVMPINIPASPEGQRKVETNREVEELTYGLPVPSSPCPIGTELEITGKKSPQESVPFNRLQASYNTSPPKPTWPEPSVDLYSTKPPDLNSYAVHKTSTCSEILPESRDSLQARMTAHAWAHDQEQSIPESRHFRSKLKISGLSPYQQRLITNEQNCDEREYSSLIDNVCSEGSEEHRKHAVKKSRSFRTEPESSALSPNFAAFTGPTESDESSRSSLECTDKSDTPWKFKIEQTKTVTSHKRTENISTNDSLQEQLHVRYTAEDSNVFNGHKGDADKTDPSSDVIGRCVIKHTSVTTRSVAKETSDTSDYSPVAVCDTKHPNLIMKKSASLDSIGSLTESKKSLSPEPHQTDKKSSSTESIDSVTQQILTPVSSEAFGIIQNTKLTEESVTLPDISTETISVPASQLMNADEVEMQKPLMVPVSSKPSLPETSKPVTDTASKPPETSSQLSVAIPNQPVERATNKMSLEKEHSQITTPIRVQGVRARILGPSSSTEQVPEFLKVQLNRVDNKPASNVVLSTTVNFDNSERSYNPLKLPDDRQTRPNGNDSQGKLTEKTNSEGAEVTLNGLSVTGTPATQTSQTSSITDTKSSRDIVFKTGTVVYDSKAAPESFAQKGAEICTSGTVVQETGQKIVAGCNNSSNKVDVTISAVASSKKRSKSFPSASVTNVTNGKYSVVSISSNVAYCPPRMVSSRPVLQKQAVSVDSADNCRSYMQKYLGEDCEDIMLVEKVMVPNVQEVSSKAPNPEILSSLKKSVSKECASSKEGDIAATEKVPETGSIEVVLRSKKIISAKDFGIKKEEETNVVERRSVGGVATVSNHEGRNSGIWREEEVQTEKRTSGGETINMQENNLGTCEVVLRKKSVSRGDIGRGGSAKDEEPELLKVFARRSLKLKDSESEAFGPQFATKARAESVSEQQGTKSRDSDKENEGGDSPREERKKQVIKEPLGESKIIIESSETIPVFRASTTGVCLSNSPRNGSIVTITNKYSRSVSSGGPMNNEHTVQNNDVNVIHRKDNPVVSPDKRQRNRTVPESPNTELNLDKTPHRAWANISKEKDVDINPETKRANAEKINSEVENKTVSSNSDESSMPRFKRIQQRKEEWEMRAQQALKKL